MNAIELYNAISAALTKGDLAAAAQLLPTLTSKLKDLAGRGWHGFALTGNDAVDAKIREANRYLGSP